MERSVISSHAASGLLHAVFLLLAFMAPVASVLESPPDWVQEGRTVRLPERVTEVTFRAPTPSKAFMELYSEGTSEAPGTGDDPGGNRPQVRVRAEPPDPTRRLAASTNAAFVDDVAGLLAGFADDTTGPDVETMLGGIDEGGGGNSWGGMGFSGMGRGASCGSIWEQQADGVKVVKTEGCKGIDSTGLSGLPGWGGRSGVEPDLGDKDSRAPRVELIASAPVACNAQACPWKEIIEKVIKRHKRELEFCYDRSLDRQKRAFGANVDVSFAIGAEGGRAQVELASSSGISNFDDCVSSRVARWVFPKTGFDIRANYPFRFQVL